MGPKIPKGTTESYSEKSSKEIAEEIIKPAQNLTSVLSDESDVKNIINEVTKTYPEPPTTCCMRACANCVWLEYAEKLAEYFKDGGEKAEREINEKVTDANLKAYLLHELRMRNKSS